MKTIEINLAGCSDRHPSRVERMRCGIEVAEKIRQSIAFMAAHLDQPLQVATLAAKVNISPSHYFALFKRQTGSAPIDYFIHLRMRRACELLDSTPASVKEIAAALGYNDPFYFSRAFKSINHLAPTGYRAQQLALKDKGGVKVPNKHLSAPWHSRPPGCLINLPLTLWIRSDDGWICR